MLLERRTTYQKTSTVGTDDVMAAMWIPTGGRLLGMKLDVHVFSHDQPKSAAGFYGTNAFLLPVDDPDAVITADTIWDRHVPKDIEEGPGAYDLDTGTAELTPEFTPGEPDLSQLFRSGPLELKGGKRRKLITFASTQAGYEGASADTYTMLDKFGLSIGGSPRVEAPSVACVGFSSPVTTETTATLWTSPAEDEWTNLQFPIWTLEQAFVELLGQVEAGAESPYEDASAFLVDYLEPDMFEETAGRFIDQSWTVYCHATMRMDVAARPQFALRSD